MSWKPEHGDPAKVLLVQWRRIGDVVLATPALDAVRKAWPGVRIHFLTQDPVPELFAGDPRVDLFWLRPPATRLAHLVRRLREERYDAVFDFQSLPTTALISRAVGGYAVGFRRRGRSKFYDRCIGLETHTGSHYAADHKLDLLRAVGLSPELTSPRLSPPPGTTDGWRDLPEGRPRVVLVPVSLRPHKRWRVDAFAETARLLHQETGAGIVIAGGPGESNALEAVAAGLSSIPHRVQEFQRLGTFSSFLAGADLYLGNDNGPRHIALAHGVPTVTWFGPQNPTHWTPPGDTRHGVIWDLNRAGGRPVRPDLQILREDPRRIARACAELLAETKS